MQILHGVWRRLRRWLSGPTADCIHPSHSSFDRVPPPDSVKILVVVEGPNDIHFLRRISAILHAADVTLPDLGEIERRGALVFIPFGGGELWPWAFRFAGLSRAEFHLYDRELSPETELRQQAADVVNLRPACCAAVTRKRSLENYLHSDAVREARGIDVEFDDDDNVPELVARFCHQRHEGRVPWDELPARDRRRRCNRTKKWLNTLAVERMTPERLAERDPQGEVRFWLETIAQLADGRV